MSCAARATCIMTCATCIMSCVPRVSCHACHVCVQVRCFLALHRTNTLPSSEAMLTWLAEDAAWRASLQVIDIISTHLDYLLHISTLSIPLAAAGAPAPAQAAGGLAAAALGGLHGLAGPGRWPPPPGPRARPHVPLHPVPGEAQGAALRPHCQVHTQ